MAHTVRLSSSFWKRPFGLPRNRIKPPIKLQQSIFPWIEEAFGPDNNAWKKDCLNEIEIDDTRQDEDEDVNMGLDDNDEDTNMEQERASSSPTAGRQSGARQVHRDVDLAKRGFLKLLVRCRRIILQE
ncbi:hypothetical protein BGZ65_011147 [Modicella reniformis]|uniref:Uncharacterized protein n=1 Tax=Modicella reniformis TaxID=1440133 RepID=A0A9P6IRD2_9FUNG|nr:hypothetical protein BGZ65_011147 [Modicella reniformis]